MATTDDSESSPPLARGPAVFATTHWSVVLVAARLHSLLVGAGDGRTTADAAVELGLSNEAVRATISRMRKRCRELVREEIANTLGSIADVEDEYSALLSALRS